MTTENTLTRDPFTLSKAVANLKSSQGPTVQISSDHINEAIAKRLQPLPENQPDTSDEMLSFWGRFWFRALRKAA